MTTGLPEAVLGDVVDRLAGPLAYARSARRHATLVELDGQQSVFSCDHPDGIRVPWTILGPYCTVSDIPPADVDRHPTAWKVTSAAVPGFAELFRELRAALDSRHLPPVEIRRWAGDSAAYRYDLDGGVSVIFHEEPFLGLTVFVADAPATYYLRPSDAFDVPHTEHIIKYPLRLRMRQDGVAQLHAASCNYQGRGIVLLGQKAAGKSTLLLHLMSRGARYMGNDMAYLRPNDSGGCAMVAFPHMTRVGDGTIGDNERLGETLRQEARTGDYLRSPVFNGGKEEFYFPVLQRMWGEDPICHRSSVDLLVFPVLDVDRRRTDSARVPREEVERRFRDALLHDPPLPDWLPAMTDDELAAMDTAIADVIAPRLPDGWELHFGPRRTDPVTEIERILAPV